jgi:hypothetical protein
MELFTITLNQSTLRIVSGQLFTWNSLLLKNLTFKTTVVINEHNIKDITMQNEDVVLLKNDGT